MVVIAPYLPLTILFAATATQAQQCVLPKRKQPGQATYVTGVLALRGEETARIEYGKMFSDYLTKIAGSRFDPPIKFQMEPVPFTAGVDRFNQVDFIFANPSMFSCVQSEVGASPLATEIAKRNVQGQVYELTEFSGVIFTKADNTEITTVADIRGKRVGCASVTSLGSGQMQFRELQRIGIHHLQDPAQVIFTNDQSKVVHEVLQGHVDVGFVRTDQLERSIDIRTGDILDLSEIKIIYQQRGNTTDGSTFPFQRSTELYPEWPFASRATVPRAVAREVQHALLNMADYAKLGSMLRKCLARQACQETDETCVSSCWGTLDTSVVFNCDTTPEIALAADEALVLGNLGGWETPDSYMSLRNMQEEIGFIGPHGENGRLGCIRHNSIDDAVVCPPGHFKKRTQDILAGCEATGLDCYGFPCVCSPCVKAFDVSFFPVAAPGDLEQRQGCSKFQVCGEVEQASSLTLRVIDNKARPNAVFKAVVIVGWESHVYEMTKLDTDRFMSHEFVFDATNQEVGMVIVEIYANDEQIDQSPFRLLVKERNCQAEFSDSRRVADSSGNCVCATNTALIGSSCVTLTTLIPSVICPIALICAIAVYFYVEKKKRDADSVWIVKPDEVRFEDPPRVLGKGTFGLVLLAEYRGTQVAVKRALPPRDKNAKATRNGSKNIVYSSEGDDVEMANRSLEDDKKFESKLFDYLSRGIKTKTSKDTNDEIDDDNQNELDTPSVFDVDFGSRSIVLSRMDYLNGSLGTSSRSGVPQDFGTKTGFFRGSTFSVGFDSDARDSKSKSFGWSAGAYSRLQKDFMEEMRHLSRLRHPCICTAMGAIISKKSEPMLLMEYMQLGSLYDLLQNNSMVLEGDLILQMIQNISQGIRFLHASTPQVLHGDLKSANVLVDSNFRAKVADFGLHTKRKDCRTGTPLWMAPELLLGETSNTSESDIYSFGMVLYEVFSRKEPFEGEDHMHVLHQIVDKRINRRPPVPMGCPPVVGRLMNQCLSRNPAERPDASHVDKILRSISGGDDFSPSTASNVYIARSSTQQTREDFLFQLFPRHIAEALRDGRKVEPQRFDCVTVFFSDIVGYTSIASKLSPEKVSDLLDRLYTKFDKLCGVHEVFKVETVGDAFMAVTNVATVQTDHHARTMANFALDVLQAASETLIDTDHPEEGNVWIRVGLHSGPVVASVCGTRNQRFSIIGDTVNCASRMESHSLPGMIQCSAETAKLLETQQQEAGGSNSEVITVKPRGVIQVKGKGRMKTYWVQSPSSSSCPAVVGTDTLSSVDKSSPRLCASTLMCIEEGNDHTEASDKDSLTSTAAAGDEVFVAGRDIIKQMSRRRLSGDRPASTCCSADSVSTTASTTPSEYFM